MRCASSSSSSCSSRCSTEPGACAVGHFLEFTEDRLLQFVGQPHDLLIWRGSLRRGGTVAGGQPDDAAVTTHNKSDQGSSCGIERVTAFCGSICCKCCAGVAHLQALQGGRMITLRKVPRRQCPVSQLMRLVNPTGDGAPVWRMEEAVSGSKQQPHHRRDEDTPTGGFPAEPQYQAACETDGATDKQTADRSPQSGPCMLPSADQPQPVRQSFCQRCVTRPADQSQSLPLFIPLVAPPQDGQDAPASLPSTTGEPSFYLLVRAGPTQLDSSQSNIQQQQQQGGGEQVRPEWLDPRDGP